MLIVAQPGGVFVQNIKSKLSSPEGESGLLICLYDNDDSLKHYIEESNC